MIRAGYKIECDDDYDRNLNNKSNVTYTTETTRYVKRESSHSDEGGSDIAPTHFSRYPQLSVASGDTDIELYDFDVGALTPKKRKQVKNACTNCQKACKKCDNGRPCPRCVKYGLQESCSDSVRKERRRGVKRGPYKKKGSDETNFPLPHTPGPPLLSNIARSVLDFNSSSASSSSFTFPSSSESSSPTSAAQSDNVTSSANGGTISNTISTTTTTTTVPNISGSTSKVESDAQSDESDLMKLNILSQLCSAVLDNNSPSDASAAATATTTISDDAAVHNAESKRSSKSSRDGDVMTTVATGAEAIETKSGSRAALEQEEDAGKTIMISVAKRRRRDTRKSRDLDSQTRSADVARDCDDDASFTFVKTNNGKEAADAADCDHSSSHFIETNNDQTSLQKPRPHPHLQTRLPQPLLAKRPSRQRMVTAESIGICDGSPTTTTITCTTSPSANAIDETATAISSISTSSMASQIRSQLQTPLSTPGSTPKRQKRAGVAFRSVASVSSS